MPFARRGDENGPIPDSKSTPTASHTCMDRKENVGSPIKQIEQDSRVAAGSKTLSRVAAAVMMAKGQVTTAEEAVVALKRARPRLALGKNQAAFLKRITGRVWHASNADLRSYLFDRDVVLLGVAALVLKHLVEQVRFLA
jgi:hypothetical protein